MKNENQKISSEIYNTINSDKEWQLNPTNKKSKQDNNLVSKCVRSGK